MSFAQLCAEQDVKNAELVERLRQVCVELRAIAVSDPPASSNFATVCLMCNHGYGPTRCDIAIDFLPMTALCGCIGYGESCMRNNGSSPSPEWFESQPCKLHPTENKCYKCRQAQ